MTTQLIAETLAKHPDWTWSVRLDSVGCSGADCEWSQQIAFKTPAAGAFRQHQAEMVAAALAAAPKPREDLTMFAALLARLGGEATITFAEATRLQGIGIVRFDEPANMAYRFELTGLDLPATASHQGEVVPEDELHATWCRRGHDGPCRRGRLTGTEKLAGEWWAPHKRECNTFTRPHAECDCGADQ